MLCTGYDNTDLSRRSALSRLAGGLGSIALGNLLTNDGYASLEEKVLQQVQHFAPKAKRVIYLFQAGGPSQMDLFDYKPHLIKETGKELPDSVRKGQRLTGMSSHQASLPLAGTPFKFSQNGNSGMWMNTELLPNIAKLSDDITLINSMQTDAINHGPAVTFLQTGSQLAGRPSMGSWLDYGLGSLNENLPAFVVLISKGQGGQPLISRLWGSGFLPGKHDVVRFRAAKDAVLYLNNPKGQSDQGRRMMLDRLKQLHEEQITRTNNAELENRIAQYEMAYRMQSSIPEVTDFKQEPDHIYELYGEDAREPGTFAANCLQARRLCERGVRFVQLYHQGWDQHGGLPKGITRQCKEVDRASYGLVTDLKQRGLLDDTVVIWGGEFGRTNYCQGEFNPKNFGRDHHPACFSTWIAGGGFTPGYTHGETDEYCYNVVKDPVHVHDFHATLLHQLGVDHTKLTYKYQGRYFRLTDVHGHVVKPTVAG